MKVLELSSVRIQALLRDTIFSLLTIENRGCRAALNQTRGREIHQT